MKDQYDEKAEELLPDDSKVIYAKAVHWRGSKTDFILDLLHKIRPVVAAALREQYKEALNREKLIQDQATAIAKFCRTTDDQAERIEALEAALKQSAFKRCPNCEHSAIRT